MVRQYELWDETPSAREFYRRLAAEVAAKANHDEAPAVPQGRRSAQAMYG
ncbi:MAG: hypothetical protein R3F44_19575 [Candidatus Competibacteraceae bacterium]